MSDDTTTTLNPVTRLARDLKRAAVELSANEARFLVDAYYQMQDNRIRSDGQIRALEKSGEPHGILDWLSLNSSALEEGVKGALDVYSQGHIVGRWARAQYGIGPVITAGLLAHIDITKAPTVGHIWNYAGLNPGVKWEKGKKRPWNAALKTLCWKIGESFVKISGNDDAYYGRLYRERKADEMERNFSGQLATKAAEALQARKFGDDTDARIWLEGRLSEANGRAIMAMDAAGRLGAAKRLAGVPGSGTAMLPPAHVHARAKRWAVKLFLSHLHAVWHEVEFGRPAPEPYAIAHLGHAHLLKPPGWPMAA